MMRIETYIKPAFTQKFQPQNILSPKQWGDYVRELEHDGCMISGNQFAYTVTFPEKQYSAAPTLGIIHKLLFDTFFYFSWHDGWLCPFDDRIHHQNITCSNGRRKQCGGLLIHPRLVDHLSPKEQRELIGRVVCYKWCHILSNAYWDISTDELLELPDDVDLVTFHIVRRVIKATGWLDWKKELAARKIKRHHQWLKAFPRK